MNEPQARIQQLEKENATLAEKVKQLEYEKAALTKDNEHYSAVNAAQEAAIEGLTEESLRLKEALEGAGNKGSLGPKEFKHKGKTYPFPAPSFRLEGFGRVTAEEALERPEILALLVEMKAGKIN